jgi:hypothetical protein
VTAAMILFQKKPSSLPDKRREVPSSRLKIRQSISLRKIHFFRMDARVKPAHDGVRVS